MRKTRRATKKRRVQKSGNPSATNIKHSKSLTAIARTRSASKDDKVERLKSELECIKRTCGMSSLQCEKPLRVHQSEVSIKKDIENIQIQLEHSSIHAATGHFDVGEYVKLLCNYYNEVKSFLEIQPDGQIQQLLINNYKINHGHIQLMFIDPNKNEYPYGVDKCYAADEPPKPPNLTNGGNSEFLKEYYKLESKHLVKLYNYLHRGNPLEVTTDGFYMRAITSIIDSMEYTRECYTKIYRHLSHLDGNTIFMINKLTTWIKMFNDVKQTVIKHVSFMERYDKSRTRYLSRKSSSLINVPPPSPTTIITKHVHKSRD